MCFPQTQRILWSILAIGIKNQDNRRIPFSRDLHETRGDCTLVAQIAPETNDVDVTDGFRNLQRARVTQVSRSIIYEDNPDVDGPRERFKAPQEGGYAVPVIKDRAHDDKRPLPGRVISHRCIRFRSPSQEDYLAECVGRELRGLIRSHP